MSYVPYDLPKPVAHDLWVIDGPHVQFYGIPFPTRMTIARLSNGGLWVHSPIRLTNDLVAQVKALGDVQHIIAPNWIHYVSVGVWSETFPDAVVWGAPGVRERAQSRGVSIRIDHPFGPDVHPSWEDEIVWHHVQGSHTHQEVVFFHHDSKTLVLTDLIENFEKKNLPFWLWPLFRLAGNYDPDGKMPFDMASTFKKGRAQLRKSVELMIAWAPERVIISHGRWYEKNGVAELKRAFRKVLK
jgi:hypothetical protein